MVKDVPSFETSGENYQGDSGNPTSMRRETFIDEDYHAIPFSEGDVAAVNRMDYEVYLRHSSRWDK